MKRYFHAGALAAGLLVMATACAPKMHPAITTEREADDTHTSQNSLDWAGVYHGELLNSSGQLLQTEVTLNSDLSYRISTRPLTDKQTVRTKKGNFSWNENGSEISLKGNDGMVTFKVGENQLVQLSDNGKSTGILIREQEEITNKYWKLIELNGEKVTVTDDYHREPHFILRANGEVSGHGGCNGFGGTYELKEGNKIDFSSMLSTMMACEGVEQEPEYLRTFERVTSYTFINDTLTLSDGKSPLARFVFVYFN